MRKFIKYGNRKLYDKTQHSYTTLGKIRELVANGVEVEVTDRKTGQDITNETLFNSLKSNDFTNEQLINLLKGNKNEETIINNSFTTGN